MTKDGKFSNEQLRFLAVAIITEQLKECDLEKRYDECEDMDEFGEWVHGGLDNYLNLGE